MPSREKARGKARRAAKESKAIGSQAVTTRQQDGSLEERTQQLQISDITWVDCKHGCPLLSPSEGEICVEFIESFIAEYTSKSFITAKRATEEKYPSVYSDKMESVVSILFSYGTQMILEGENGAARLYAMLACYFKEWLAVEVLETKASPNWTKIVELGSADDHTLVSYYRKRIPCSCLDKKYEEVKSVKKMGRCYNVNCSLPGGRVERSKMYSCTRCCNANYCSIECQKAHWKRHRQECCRAAEMKANAALNSQQS